MKYSTSRDGGLEYLAALSADGGVRRLAEWWGDSTFVQPSWTMVDDQRAMAVFGYPGPQDAGMYSVLFCP